METTGSVNLVIPSIGLARCPRPLCKTKTATSFIGKCWRFFRVAQQSHHVLLGLAISDHLLMVVMKSILVCTQGLIITLAIAKDSSFSRGLNKSRMVLRNLISTSVKDKDINHPGWSSIHGRCQGDSESEPDLEIQGVCCHQWRIQR